MNTTPLGKHPNTALSIGTAGVGVVVVWALGYLGVSMPGEVAVIVGGGITSLSLLIGRKGVKGIGRLVWHGSDE